MNADDAAAVADAVDCVVVDPPDPPDPPDPEAPDGPQEAAPVDDSPTTPEIEETVPLTGARRTVCSRVSWA